MTIPAKYEHGVFKPLQKVAIQEGAIVEISLPREPMPAAVKPPRIADSPFSGIWKDREEMKDSIAYVNRLRGNLHG